MATARSIAIRKDAAILRIADALGVEVSDLAPSVKDQQLAQVEQLNAIADLVESQAAILRNQSAKSSRTK